MRIQAHQPQPDPVPLGRQAESARGGERQGPRVARDLADHAGKVAAAHAFLEREERVFRRGGGDMDHPMPPRGRKARKARAPAAPDRLPVLHPQDLASVFALSQ